MYRFHDTAIILRSGDCKDLRMNLANLLGALAQAAGDDNLAIGSHGLADDLQGFGRGGIYEAAGIDDNDIGVFIVRRKVIPFGPQLRQDAFGIDQSFRTAERYYAYARVSGHWE